MAGKGSATGALPVLDIPAALAWLHRNERSVWEGTLRHQDLAALIPKFRDPLLDLTSGALVRGEKLRMADRRTLRSQAPGRHQGRTVFSQVMDYFPEREFQSIVERYEGNKWVQSFTCRSHFNVMAFAQLTGRESLRDIETCLAASQRSDCKRPLSALYAQVTDFDFDDVLDVHSGRCQTSAPTEGWNVWLNMNLSVSARTRQRLWPSWPG